MEEKYYLFDILSTMKNMTVNMAISLNEASCDNIYKLFYKMFKDVTDAQRSLYTLAYNKGWYKLESAENNKICEEVNKIEDELETSLEYKN